MSSEKHVYLPTTIRLLKKLQLRFELKQEILFSTIKKKKHFYQGLILYLVFPGKMFIL